jgi:hypothetical protein
VVSCQSRIHGTESEAEVVRLVADLLQARQIPSC